MKIETRGKYPGVKIHLDPDECQKLESGVLDLKSLPDPEKAVADGWVAWHKWLDHADSGAIVELLTTARLGMKMGKMVKELQEENPDLLTERTPEQIAAILAKESEKARLQLEALKKGANWKKIEPSKLKSALLAHVK